MAIYGKNGGGKSNLIRAFWLAVKFICNAQMTQGAGVLVPVDPFKLNDYSTETPTSFEFIYKYSISMAFLQRKKRYVRSIFIITQKDLEHKFSKEQDRNFLLFKIKPLNN